VNGKAGGRRTSTAAPHMAAGRTLTAVATNSARQMGGGHRFCVRQLAPLSGLSSNLLPSEIRSRMGMWSAEMADEEAQLGLAHLAKQGAGIVQQSEVTSLDLQQFFR